MWLSPIIYQQLSSRFVEELPIKDRSGCLPAFCNDTRCFASTIVMQKAMVVLSLDHGHNKNRNPQKDRGDNEHKPTSYRQIRIARAFGTRSHDRSLEGRRYSTEALRRHQVFPPSSPG